MSSFPPLSIILETKAIVLAQREQNIPSSSTSSSSSSYTNTDELIEQYESLLAFSHSESCVDALMELKKFVLIHGIPSTDQELLQSSSTEPAAMRTNGQMSTLQTYGSDCLRARIWKLLLGVPLYFDVDQYLKKSEDSTNQFDAKIKDDAFRTFKVDELFWSRTSEETMIRILKILATDIGYVQGMNVILGPFLYIMPELDSYYCCYTLFTEHIPSYIRKNLEGVHSGITLVDKCLKILDPQLHHHILAKLNDLRIFSLRYILTLMSNVQPLNEVLKLWDGLFAFGIHLIIIIVCNYLINLRDELLIESSSFKICNIIEKGNLDSELLLKMSITSIEFIPEEIYEELVDHIY